MGCDSKKGFRAGLVLKWGLGLGLSTCIVFMVYGLGFVICVSVLLIYLDWGSDSKASCVIIRASKEEALRSLVEENYPGAHSAPGFRLHLVDRSHSLTKAIMDCPLATSVS